jgi:hypothetical protein
MVPRDEHDRILARAISSLLQKRNYPQDFLSHPKSKIMQRLADQPSEHSKQALSPHTDDAGKSTYSGLFSANSGEFLRTQIKPREKSVYELLGRPVRYHKMLTAYCRITQSGPHNNFKTVEIVLNTSRLSRRRVSRSPRCGAETKLGD